MSMLRSLLLAFVLLPVAASANSLGEPRIRGGIVSPPVAYGDFVYAASGISVEIWNVADAAHFAKTGLAPAEHPPGPIFGLAIRGDFLYVGWTDDARTTGGFQIYSLADPAHPARVGEAATMHADKLLANGDFLYEVDGQLGLTAIDASDPLHPVVASNVDDAFSIPPSVYTAQFKNGHLYVSGSTQLESCFGVIFDLADPAHPRQVGMIGLGAFGRFGSVSDSGYALGFGDAGGVYDVRDPTHVELVGSFSVGVDLGVRGALIDAFRGDDLYLFGGDELPVYDFSTPTAPVPVAQASLDTNDLFAVTPLSSGFLATSLTGRGFLIDASTPSAPALRGEIALPSATGIVDTAFDGRNVYAIGEGHALEVVDAASLENVAVIDAPADDDGFALGYSSSVGLSHSTAIISGYLTLFAVDVADAANPHVVGSLPIDSFSPILVSGDRAYVQTNDGALTVVDIADPTAPAVRGALAGLYYTPLAAAGTRVFTYGSDLFFVEGVHIIDASDPAQPVAVGAYVPCIGDSFRTLAASGDGATIAIVCSDGSVEFVDAHNSSNATLAATYRPADPIDGLSSIAAHGTMFYVGNAHGVDEVDASDPVAPVFVVRHPTASSVQALRTAPNGSLLALTSAGMYVFDCVASGGERP
ncbi:MAG TPA: hypothetical protein VJX31_09110, partial [Casimicrobiaceae bacterium]|nr:hypothetical protein [Casimicrobiaceae bacterium]